jgi:hypothetical protein
MQRKIQRLLRKALKRGIAPFLGIVVFTAPHAAAANLLDDGSFDIFADGRFDRWEIGPKPDPDGVTKFGTIAQDPQGGYPKGGNAAKFAFTGSGTYTLVALGPEGLMLPMDPGKKYRLTIRAKSSGEPILIRTEVRPRAAGERERTRTVNLNFKATDEWQEKTVEWEAAENETSVNVVFYLENRASEPATVWLDEVSLDML